METLRSDRLCWRRVSLSERTFPLEGNGNFKLNWSFRVGVDFSPKGLSRWKGMETNTRVLTNWIGRLAKSERTFPLEGNGNRMGKVIYKTLSTPFGDTFPVEGNGNPLEMLLTPAVLKSLETLSRWKGIETHQWQQSRLWSRYHPSERAFPLEVGGWELAISQERLKAISLPDNSRLKANLHIFSGLKGLILSGVLLFDVYNVISAIGLLFIS